MVSVQDGTGMEISITHARTNTFNKAAYGIHIPMCV